MRPYQWGPQIGSDDDWGDPISLCCNTHKVVLLSPTVLQCLTSFRQSRSVPGCLGAFTCVVKSAMVISMIPGTAFGLLLCLIVYRFVIVPGFLSPLSKAPAAHWSAPYSRAWILWYRSREEETLVVHRAHERLGPTVRIAPNELSINSVDGGLRTIYSGGYEKGDW